MADEARSTKQVVEVLYKETTPAIQLRSTKQVLEVLHTQVTSQTLNADIIATAIIDTILSITAPLAATITTTAIVGAELSIKNHFDAVITVNATVIANLTSTIYDYFISDIDTETLIVADLTLPTLVAGITAIANVQVAITGKRQFITNITGTTTFNADLTNLTLLTADITANGDVTAELRKNIEYLTTDIIAIGDISAKLDVPWHAGNTLDLQHSVTVILVKNESVTNILNLQHEVDLIFGQRFFFVTHIISFVHEATAIRVLPTKTASSTLSLTQLLSNHREAISYLSFTQSAIGVIVFFEGIASSALNLTDSASLAGSVFSLSAESQLNLTQSVSSNQIVIRTATNSLFLQQNVFAVILESKKYVLFQAPFELIQTSVILPNPLLDDNEGLISSLITRRSMDNILRTYVQTTKNRRLRYTFVLNRLKALELEAFFDAYNGTSIKMLNWKGEIWRVKLITNPIDFVQTRRAEPGGDRTDVNLEFEGVKLYG